LAVGSWQLAVGSWQLAVGSNFKKLLLLLKQFFTFNCKLITADS
jgi:hypothetical protein